jgi:hypothetical protein
MNLNQEKQIPHSPSQGIVNRLTKFKDEKERGIYHGIPLWESFPTLGEVVGTIDKGQVVLNAAASGVGKSMITRFKDIIAAWLFVKRHPELEIDLKFVIFLLEDETTRFEDYITSILLYLKFNLEISPKNLRSSFKAPLSQDILNKIILLQPAIDDLLSRCTIEDSTYNSYGIYKKCRMLSEEWGNHYYIDMIEGNNTLHKSEYNNLKVLPKEYEDVSLVELKNKFGLKALEYQNFYKYSHYIANNEKEHVIVVVDNINCLVPDKWEDGLKGSMDKFMYHYARTNMAKHWKWSIIAVQQNVGGAEEQSFTNRGDNIIEKLIPSLDKLGDSKLTQRACHLIYGLFDPYRYGINSYMGYNVSKFKNKIRFLFILKNNDGECNKVIPLYFAGGASYFEELPLPDKITDEVYKKYNIK